jgi:hypothetical protein
MIPWDARVFNRDKRFTRQRVTYKEKERDSLYVLSDEVYMTIDDYYDDNGFTENLNYDGLKVSFVTDFKYEATSFSINLAEEQKEYLSFDLSNSPNG